MTSPPRHREDSVADGHSHPQQQVSPSFLARRFPSATLTSTGGGNGSFAGAAATSYLPPPALDLDPSGNLRGGGHLHPIPMTPQNNSRSTPHTLSPSVGPSSAPPPVMSLTSDTVAVDVQGFYGQGGLVPTELPTSAILYVLTTSEGRDKLFKVLQYSLKLGIWVLCLPNVLPEVFAPFTSRWTERLAGNVQTIRNGRSMFKLGRWLICMFHLKVVVERLLAKHAPWLLHDLFQWWARVCRLVLWPLRALQTKPKTNLAEEEEEGRLLQQQKPLDSKECAARLEQEEVEERKPLRPPPPLTMSSRRRTVRFGVASSSSVEEKLDENALSLEVVEAPPSATATPPPPDSSNSASQEEVQGEMLPATNAFASSWRRAVDDFSTPWALVLALRCSASIVRNILRDTIFLSDKRFVLLPQVQANRASLQQLTSRAWVLVSLCDVALNSSRLFQNGWFRFIGSRRNRNLVCLCHSSSHHGTASPRSVLVDERYVQRKQHVTFPPTDLDFGSVATTTAKFFEAADPKHLAPYCNVCGCLLWERTTTGQTTPSTSRQPTPLFVPFLIRWLSDVWWVCTTHSNLTETLLLQVRYMCDAFCALGYAAGDYEPVVGETPLAQHLHVTGSLAGLCSALIALRRVRLSAPS